MNEGCAKHITPDFCDKHFSLVHSFVMQHIREYLKEVPTVEYHSMLFHLRECGENQPVSPTSFLLTFYTQMLVVMKENNKEIPIPKEDACLLVEASLLSGVFLAQFKAGIWNRNGDEIRSLCWYYTRPYYFANMLSDFLLQGILVEHVGQEWFMTTLFLFYRVISITQEKEIILCDKTLASSAFIHLANIIRNSSKRFDKHKMARDVIIHLTAAGMKSPNEILKFLSTPFNFTNKYNSVCSEKGVLRKECYSEINPFFPFLHQQQSQDLLDKTLLSPEPLPFNRFIHDFTPTDQTKQLLSDKLITHITKMLLDEGETSFLPFVLVLMCDEARHVPETRTKHKKLLNRIGTELRKSNNAVLKDASIVMAPRLEYSEEPINNTITQNKQTN